MIVKTLHQIFKHTGAHAFFSLNLRVSSQFERVAGSHARIARERRSDRKHRVLSWFAIRRMNRIHKSDAGHCLGLSLMPRAFDNYLADLQRFS